MGVSHQTRTNIKKIWQRIFTSLRAGELENLPSRVTLDSSKKFRSPEVDLNEADHN